MPKDYSMEQTIAEEDIKKRVFAKRVIDNILDLANEKGISKAELEKEAGISAGYISRLSRPDNTTVPNVEVLLAFSKKLGVTIDYLVNPRIKDSEEQDDLLIRFLNKLTNETVSGELEWIAETPDELNNMTCVDPHTGATDHPLFKTIQSPQPWPTEYPEYEGRYISFFGDRCKSNFNGDCYHVELPVFSGRPVLYVMNIETYELIDVGDGVIYDKPIDCFELCLISDDIEPLCRTDLMSSEVEDAVKKLYYSIKRELDSNKLSKAAKSVLERYLGDDVPF